MPKEKQYLASIQTGKAFYNSLLQRVSTSLALGGYLRTVTSTRFAIIGKPNILLFLVQLTQLLLPA